MFRRERNIITLHTKKISRLNDFLQYKKRKFGIRLKMGIRSVKREAQIFTNFRNYELLGTLLSNLLTVYGMVLIGGVAFFLLVSASPSESETIKKIEIFYD